MFAVSLSAGNALTVGASNLFTLLSGHFETSLLSLRFGTSVAGEYRKNNVSGEWKLEASGDRLFDLEDAPPRFDGRRSGVCVTAWACTGTPLCPIAPAVAPWAPCSNGCMMSLQVMGLKGDIGGVVHGSAAFAGESSGERDTDVARV
jgi:hypothetical protein